MKTLFQYIFSIFSLLILFSCSNDFLNEEPEFPAYTEAGIYISPEWGTNDYPIHFSSVKNEKFTIENEPQWLNLTTGTGQFNNGVAYINCSASKNSDFSKVGIYSALMTLNIENKGKQSVQVSYINEGNPVFESENSLKLGYNTGFQVFFPIKNSGEGLLVWEITAYPEWITIQNGFQQYPYNIIPQYSESGIHFSYNKEYAFAGEITGKIVIKSNDKNKKEIVIDVVLDAGSPSLACDYNEFDFGRSETSRSLWFYNRGDGLLTWKIENCPEWIIFSEENGLLYPSYSENLSIALDRNKLPENISSTVVTLKTNDKKNPAYPITIKWRSAINSENVKAIDGTITDAWLDKNKDILYLTTSQPNRFVAYDTKSKTISREITLSKAPTCFSVSEDGRKAVVGHGGLISSIDMDKFSVAKTVTINESVFDIEWGANDWVCYTLGSDVQWSRLYWVNLQTNEKQTSEKSIYGSCVVKKVPQQDYIIGSESNLSSGVYVFDINKRQITNDIFTSFGQFWFSADGAYLFDAWKHVCRTSAVLKQSEISFIDKLNYNSSNATWIDHHAASNSLWVLPSLFSHTPYNTNAEVLQLEATDYTVVKTYQYDDYYRVTTNGATTEYPVKAYYVFANGLGTEVIVIKAVTDNYNATHNWLLEHIPVN